MNIETLPEQYYKDLITTPSQWCDLNKVSQTLFSTSQPTNYTPLLYDCL